MCEDSLIPNMRREDEDIVAANLKEGDHTSTDDLLKKLIEIDEEQNKLLEKNNTISRKLNFVLLIIASLSFLSALASTQIAAHQLWVTRGDATGMGIFAVLCVIAIILEITAWIIVLSPPK